MEWDQIKSQKYKVSIIGLFDFTENFLVDSKLLLQKFIMVQKSVREDKNKTNQELDASEVAMEEGIMVQTKIPQNFSAKINSTPFSKKKTPK